MSMTVIRPSSKVMKTTNVRLTNCLKDETRTGKVNPHFRVGALTKVGVVCPAKREWKAIAQPGLGCCDVESLSITVQTVQAQKKRCIDHT
jgi:hypothetical protein